MNNLIAESIKDLEFILTEWEGGTNALLGAVRVNVRLDRITPILTALAEKTREEERVRVWGNLPKIITPTVEPPPNGLSQNQIFAIGQMNMLLRVFDLLESLDKPVTKKGLTMRKMPLKERYKCEYCNYIRLSTELVLQHETICYKNADRNCPICSNEGVEFINVGGLGGYVEGEKPCTACEKAKLKGGKSYLDIYLKD